MTRYVYRWPSGLSVTAASWRPVHRVGRTTSLLTGALYQTETARPRIEASVTVISGAQFAAGLLDVFLANLSGGGNLAYLADWTRCASGLAQPEYVGGQREVLWSDDDGGLHHWNDDGTSRPWRTHAIKAEAGAAVGSKTLKLSGLWPSRLAFARGAEIGVGGWRHVVAADAAADDQGEAAVALAPRLRASVSKGDPIDHALWGLFALKGDPDDMGRDVAGVMRPTLNFIQVFEDELGAEDLVYEDS